MKASVFCGISLDGFLARPDGALDFLPADGSEAHGYEEFIASVDAIVIGRGTYETVLGFGSWPYTKPVIVLSSTLSRLTVPKSTNCTLMSGEPQDIVARLAERGFTHLYVDGGITIQRFLSAGLITHITVTRVPVLIGRGIPLFGPLPKDIRLTHERTRAFPSGLVSSEYSVCA
jgi:dihydrofolate reductase